MKKALAGPAKRTAKKKPERRAMIAATRRRIAAIRGRASKRTGPALRRRRLIARVRLEAFTRRADRAVDRWLVRAWPLLSRTGRRLRMQAVRLERWTGRRLRPVARVLFHVLARLERGLLRGRALAIGAATRASAVLTPERGICLTILAAAGCLLAAQFVDYRAVQIGQPGYAGLSAASVPTVDAEAAGQAHAYLLVPVALLAAALALVVLRKGRRRGLGRIVFALGLLSLAVVLLVDLPAGTDAGEFASRFSGANAVLLDGFYAQIAAAAGLMLGGLLLVAAPRAAARYDAGPCRTRTNLLGRAASALRRRRRRRASSRDRATRRGSRRRSGAVSAPVSPR
jgi:hypothetical protein